MPQPIGKRIGFLAIKVAVSLLVTLVLLEVALHVFPSLIPNSYRRLYPLHGVGFFEPELLDRTPIDQVPLPLYVGDYVGPPPSDLSEHGIVPDDEDSDARRFPEVELRVDSLGLPNLSIPERADVVLVGDSFMVCAGGVRPRGLQSMLAEALDKVVYNLGVAATGPFQQLWLLETEGLPKRPELVLWFFFGGNDPLDTATMLRHKNRGEDTYGKVHAGREPPTFRLPSIVRHLVGSKRARRRIEPHPGLSLTQPGGSTQLLWMLPDYVWILSWTAEQWEGYPGWTGSKDALRQARDLTEEAGARFLVVYLPSKAEVYLPYVDQDAELIARMADFGRPKPVTPAPELFLEMALRHRGDLELLLRDFCEAEDIAYLSATSCLEEVAQRGAMCFLAADTHWDSYGQEALVPELLEELGK